MDCNENSKLETNLNAKIKQGQPNVKDRLTDIIHP